MAITPTSEQVGRLSVSLRFASGNGTDTVSNAALLAACSERGPLYALLNKTYGSLPAFLTAWAQAGGMLSVQSDRPTTCVVWWTLSAGAPQLTVTDTGVGAVAARIALSYSAGR